MLTGVAFLRHGEKGIVRPQFVNQYVLTDVFIASMTSPLLETPILPSIATLPRVDPRTSELLLYHSTFAPPYVQYSIIAPSQKSKSAVTPASERKIHNAPVAGMRSPKMMHDFGVSSTHTIIMDLPLSLDPLNLAKNKPVVEYDPNSVSRFGVFPRYQPHDVRWFETNPCCIFHTANSWNSPVQDPLSKQGTVNMLACRLTSASLVFSAGDLAAPVPISATSKYEKEEEQCRLYYFEFQLGPQYDPDNSGSNKHSNVILNQWALSAIPFEFPSLSESHSMSAAKFIYGCSVEGTSFGAALGRAVKIDSLVKVDVERLIEKGKAKPPTQIAGCVDERGISEILASEDLNDPIRVFKLPLGWYAQESRFVPRSNGNSEDDGWLLAYVFDESQLKADGECPETSRSELWVIDAKSMTDVVARVYLPQRVPYGLHGNWFSEDQILNQRPATQSRSIPRAIQQITSFTNVATQA
ncbi:MAG: hypothetical protein Q9195_000906 [Heterodermia aff. obscurata]